MKKSYIALILIILVSVAVTRFTDTDPNAAPAATYVSEAGAVISEVLEQEATGPEASAPEATAKGASIEEASDDGDNHWGNPNTLHDHYQRHGADFDAKDAQDYARQAHEFYENRAQHQVKMQGGVARVYDAETNTFGAYNANGTTRTFYKPSAGQAYFDRQPGD